MPANPARGEVAVTINGEEFVLAGTFARLAAYQGAMGVQGLPALLTSLAAMDPRAIYEGIRALAVSGNLKRLEAATFHEGMRDAQTALLKAVMGPEAPDEGNGQSAEASPN